MSRKNPFFMLTMVPCEIPECPACRSKEDGECLRPSPPYFNDLAMSLARRGADAHTIVHMMLEWASEAADRAIEWSEREDKRYAQEDAEAIRDFEHGTEYEK